MAQELPTGTVTFLFTDLEGSTRLWEEHPEAMRAALARHDEILRDAVSKRDGVVVKTTGDGLHAAFGTAPDAVAAALDAQRALVAEEWVLPEPLSVRMGLHTGIAELREGDYYGTSVNRAARVAAAAHGGQIVASAATADLVRDELSTDVRLHDLGEHRLRDLGRPERIAQITHPELESEFPPLRSLDAYPGNLPVQRSAFVGRERDLAEVRAALDDAPVVTLTGVGGVGKTRLALQVAADAVGRFADGAWFVDLGPVLDAGFVAAAISTALLLPERRHESLEESIVAALRDKILLVVLDNCEHLVEAVATLVDRLVESCPGVRVLATSREALDVEGEETYEVRPLPPPESDPAAVSTGALLDNDAVRLFGERARVAKRGFALTPHNVTVVADLCRRLDGIPLAIELAAARLKVMSPAEILGRLDERFQLLTGGRRTVLERHQTLRGAVDWSYALLEPSEQRLFARLSVFAGGFTLDAAEAISRSPDDPDADETHDVLSLLASLVAKSMVVTDDTEAGTRYRLLETLREYAAERLAELDEVAGSSAAHAAYFLALAEDASQGLTGPDDARWIAVLSIEEDNFRSALAWTRDHQPEDFLGLVLALARFWYVTSEFHGSVPWCEVALERSETMDAAARARLKAHAAIAVGNLRGVDAAIPLAEASLEDASRAGISPPPRALAQLGILALESNRPAEAIARCEEAVAVAREHADRWSYLDALYMLSLACNLGGDPDQGREVSAELLEGARRLGNAYLLHAGLFSSALANLVTEPALALELLDEAGSTAHGAVTNMRGQVCLFRGVANLRLGQRADAARALADGIEPMLATGSDFFVSTIIGTSASLIARSAPVEAATLLAALEEYTARSGIAGAPADVEQRRRVREKLEDSMPSAAFEEARTVGMGLSMDEAAALTLAELRKLAP